MPGIRQNVVKNNHWEFAKWFFMILIEKKNKVNCDISSDKKWVGNLLPLSFPGCSVWNVRRDSHISKFDGWEVLQWVEETILHHSNQLLGAYQSLSEVRRPDMNIQNSAPNRPPYYGHNNEKWKNTRWMSVKAPPPTGDNVKIRLRKMS